MVMDKPTAEGAFCRQNRPPLWVAVRFCLFIMAGVAHLARLSKNEGKRRDCLRLWENMVQRQLYVLQAALAPQTGEAFSSDYDLPNDTVYAESCASIGLMMFARRMRNWK